MAREDGNRRRLVFVTNEADGSIDEVPSLRSAAEFVAERVWKRPCDHEAISDCERCNVNYLASVVLRAAREADGGE